MASKTSSNPRFKLFLPTTKNRTPAAGPFRLSEQKQ